MSTSQPELVRLLRDTITNEVIISLGLRPSTWVRGLLGPLIWPAAGKFAEIVAAFDRDVTELGFVEGARRLLSSFVQGCQQFGADSIPGTGPLLLASNHSGGTDGIAIAASLPRDDLRIVISDVPFTRAVPCGRDHLIYTPMGAEGRVHTIREILHTSERAGPP